MIKESRIEFTGNGDGYNDKGIHFVGLINDYTLCGLSLDGDIETFGSFKHTTKKVNCKECIDIIEYCKSIKRNKYY